MAVDAGEAGDQRCAVIRLELGEFAAVNNARDDVVYVVGNARVDRHDVIKLVLIGGRLDRRRDVPQIRLPWAQRGDDAAHDPQRVAVVVRQMVGDTRCLGVQVAAAEFLCGDHLPGRRLHQRRAAEEDRALVAHDHGLIAHGGHIRAARGARAQHRGDLRDAFGASSWPGCRRSGRSAPGPGNTSSCLGQERAAGVDQIDAWQPVLPGDLLGAQVLFHGDRVVGAALDRRVVGDDHAFAARHPADAGDDARTAGIRRRTFRPRPVATAPETGCRGRAGRRHGRAATACPG